VLALGGHGGPWVASVGIDLVSSIHVARSSPTWGCRILEVRLSRITLKRGHNVMEMEVQWLHR
jgi:hypothetical protein